MVDFNTLTRALSVRDLIRQLSHIGEDLLKIRDAVDAGDREAISAGTKKMVARVERMSLRFENGRMSWRRSSSQEPS